MSGGGSGVISATTGLATSSGSVCSSGTPTVTAARTAVRSAWTSSTSTTLIRRPRLRTTVASRTGPGSGAPRKFAETARGDVAPADAPAPSRAASWAALAHSATITPPWIFGPIVQCGLRSAAYTGPAGCAGSSARRSVMACEKDAVVAEVMSAQQMCSGELQRLAQQCLSFGLGAGTGRGDLQHHMAGEATRGEQLAHLRGRLSATAGHQ